MPIGIGIAAVGIGKAALGASAANQAAKAQQQASQQNLQTQQQILGQTTANLQPFVGYGQNAGGALQGLLGIGGNPGAQQQAFQNYLGSTNYNFLLNQGLQGQSYLNASNLYSGATEKALNNYAQGMAGNALQGYEGLLQNQQQMGIGAGSSLGYISSGLAAQEAQARNLAAGAQGSAALYGANQYGNALGGIGNLFGQSSYGGGGNALGNFLGNNFGLQTSPTGFGSAFQQEQGFGQVAGLF